MRCVISSTFLHGKLWRWLDKATTHCNIILTSCSKREHCYTSQSNHNSNTQQRVKGHVATMVWNDDVHPSGYI